jgi:hypothetical protein
MVKGAPEIAMLTTRLWVLLRDLESVTRRGSHSDVLLAGGG